MRPWHIPLLLGLSLALPSELAAEIFPPEFEATYSLHTKGFEVGRMIRELDAGENGTWVFRSQTSATGIVGFFRREEVRERSRWLREDGRVYPLRYHYERSGGKNDRTVSVRFDWSKSQVLNTYNDRSWRMEVPPGTLDKLLYQLVMMRDLARQSEALVYDIADGGKMKTYRFEVLREEAVETHLGSFDTLVIERASSDSKKRTTIWCARGLHYLPVKVSHTDKRGNETLVLLEQVEGLPSAP